VLLLVLSAVPITFHVTPFGPVGLTMFIAAILSSREIDRPPARLVRSESRAWPSCQSRYGHSGRSAAGLP
jgi:hypothetical protein